MGSGDYKTLADVMAEYDAERIAEIERDEARRATPEAGTNVPTGLLLVRKA